jgi:hypothetical protein
MIANGAIVCNMGVRHKQVIATDLSEATILLGASMHRREFTDGISIADLKPGYLGRIFFILWIFTDR